MPCEAKQTTVSNKTALLISKLSEQSKALAAEIQDRAKGIDPDIDTSGVDVWVGLDVDIGWERTEFSLDLPEVAIKDQEWSLDLPQVTMKDQTIIFHLPSIRMKTVKTGEYPETVCQMVTKDIGMGIKIDVPECTVRWSPIYVDLPEPFMEEHKIVMGIPEFRMDRTSFVIGVPEFTMKTQTFALHLPQITIKQISVEASKAEAEGKALSAESNVRAEKLKEHFREDAKLQLGHDVTDLFDCYQQDLMTKKNDALKRFDDGINLLQSTIAAMASNKVPDDSQNLVAVKNSLADLIGKRDAFAADISAKFSALSDQQKSFFDRLIGK